MKVQRAPEASSLAKMCKHFTAANELKSNVKICCILTTTIIIYAFHSHSMIPFIVSIMHTICKNRPVLKPTTTRFNALSVKHSRTSNQCSGIWPWT